MAHTAPKPGRREAGTPPERGNARRRAAMRSAATSASWGRRARCQEPWSLPALRTPSSSLPR
eukprot:7619324-Alexandrium_andersonii.AAC.1